MSPRTKNRLVLLAIISPFVLFFLAGHFLVDPWSLPRVNKGQLIIPHIPLADLKVSDAQGAPYDGNDTAGKWTLMYIAGSGCESACKNGLYYQMRQVQQALGEDARRLRRLIVLTAPPADSLRHFLDDKVTGMVEVHGELAVLKGVLAEVYQPNPSAPVGDIFLVSPDGQIFMRYPTHEDMDATLEEAENIRVDLKRTLKGSLIG
ncbi:MAG: SCO family protein [Alcanivorax sp.]|nr:SCO family protein [Alcanivorax sp.]